jgi:hypothetical protein
MEKNVKELFMITNNKISPEDLENALVRKVSKDEIN